MKRLDKIEYMFYYKDLLDSEHGEISFGFASHVQVRSNCDASSIGQTSSAAARTAGVTASPPERFGL
jgi:hypothetical protein